MVRLWWWYGGNCMWSGHGGGGLPGSGYMQFPPYHHGLATYRSSTTIVMQVVEGTACSQTMVVWRKLHVDRVVVSLLCVFVPSGDHVLERTVDHVTSLSSPPHLPLPPPSPLPWPIISLYTSSLTYLLPSLPSSPPSALRSQVRRHYVCGQH